MAKTKILNVRIDPDLKRKAKRLAESDGRTLSNWVTRLIEQQVRDTLAGSPRIFAASESGEKKSPRHKGKGNK